MADNYKTLNYRGRTVFSKIIMEDFKRIVKYFQEDEACFMFIDNGDFLLRTPEETIHFESGDGLLAKCGNYYFENKMTGKLPESRTEIIAAYFYPSIVKKLFDEDIGLSNYRTNYDASKIKIDKLLTHFRDNISFLIDNPDIADEVLILTKLKEFLLLLSKTEKAPSVTDFVSSLFKPIEYNFKSIIKKNIFSSLSLEEFATLSGMSLASFKRKFKTIYSESPRKYISKKKMEKAAKMLSAKENRISDIAYNCGFDTTVSFNRNFKTRFGKSPSKYRNSLFEPK